MSRGSNYAGANSRLLTSHPCHQSTERGSRRETLLGLFVGLTMLVFMLTASQLPAFSTNELITVLPGQDLQIAIDEAPEGSTIILQAGESYKGALCIHKSITIRTDAPHEALGDIIEIALLDAACGFDTAIVVEAGTARIDGPIYVYEGVVDLIGLSIRAADSIGVTVNGGSLSMKRCLISYCVNGVHLMHSSKATISDCAILSADIVGILVEADAYVKIDNTYIGSNGADGIRLLGEATIRGTFISENGFVRISGGQVELAEKGDGIEVLRGARLELRESWIVRNGGSGIHFYALGYEDEQTPHVAGAGNVIPDLYEADANLQGAVRPYLGEVSEEQEDLCWPATFLAMTYARPTKFEWQYYGEDYVLDSVLEIPVGGFTCELHTIDGTRKGGEPRTAPDAFTHFTNATSLAPIVDQLMEFAETDEYQGLALADFILQFALQNTSYDYERYEESRPSGYLIPTVTLAKREGICRDTAALVGVLLELAGFDSILVLLPPLDPEDSKGHMVVGVDVEGAWGQFVDYDGKRFYLVDTTHSWNHIGGYSIKDWAEPALIDVLFAPELVAEMSCFDLATVSESGNLGELRVRNRGSSSSPDASVHLYVGFSLAPDSADALSWDIGALQPGEEHVLIVPNDDGIIASQVIEAWSEDDFLVLQVIIKMGESTDRFPLLFSPGYSTSKCP